MYESGWELGIMGCCFYIFPLHVNGRSAPRYPADAEIPAQAPTPCMEKLAVHARMLLKKDLFFWPVNVSFACALCTELNALMYLCACVSACVQVFYLNTAKSNLFNGPLLQYFNSEGTEGPYASDVEFGRTGRCV